MKLQNISLTLSEPAFITICCSGCLTSKKSHQRRRKRRHHTWTCSPNIQTTSGFLSFFFCFRAVVPFPSMHFHRQQTHLDPSCSGGVLYFPYLTKTDSVLGSKEVLRARRELRWLHSLCKKNIEKHQNLSWSFSLYLVASPLVISTQTSSWLDLKLAVKQTADSSQVKGSYAAVLYDILFFHFQKKGLFCSLRLFQLLTLRVWRVGKENSYTSLMFVWSLWSCS